MSGGWTDFVGTETTYKGASMGMIVACIYNQDCQRSNTILSIGLACLLICDLCYKTVQTKFCFLSGGGPTVQF